MIVLSVIDEKNILQIDVEDWFCDLPVVEWKNYESRVVQSTRKILSILKERNTKATFFVLGSVARSHPELVKSIKNDGHEVASHGYYHTPVTRQNPEEFEEDLCLSLEVLEDIIREPILGYRAPQFSIVEKTGWAIGVLKRNGLKYDSSVFPVKTHLYGVPNAPRFPYHISPYNIEKNSSSNNNLLEFPLSVYRFLGKNIPIAGGFYLRFFPYWFISHAIKKINKSGYPAVCYLHPWELDVNQPRVRGLGWYHYYRLSSTESKFRKLLEDFKFTSTKNWIDTHEI